MLYTEWDFYKKNRLKFLEQYLNRFIVIVGEEVKGDYATLGEAYRVGKEIYGMDKFMIQKISDPEERVAICSKPSGSDERERPKMLGFCG